MDVEKKIPVTGLEGDIPEIVKRKSRINRQELSPEEKLDKFKDKGVVKSIKSITTEILAN